MATKCSIFSVFSVPEFRLKLYATFLLLFFCRIGVMIPVPGVDKSVIFNYFSSVSPMTTGAFQLMNVFSGGAFSHMTITSLGIIPYISASILVQLLVSLNSNIQREMFYNPAYGRKKVNYYIKICTVVLSFVQSIFFARYALYLNESYSGIIHSLLLSRVVFGIPLLFYLLFSVSVSVGTLFLVWIGNLISEIGIGNGISWIICLGIISNIPKTFYSIISNLSFFSMGIGQISFLELVLMIIIFVLVIIFCIQLTQGYRKIPIKHARRVIGIKEIYNSGSSYIPIKVNYVGVIPVIFSSSVLMFLNLMSDFFKDNYKLAYIYSSFMNVGGIPYIICMCIMIIGFSYVWTIMQFNPDNITSEIKKNGAFIPGVRQGKATVDYIKSVANYVTIIGGVMLSGLVAFPYIINYVVIFPSYVWYLFGGTSILILVGVLVDLLFQVESYIMTKNYKGSIFNKFN